MIYFVALFLLLEAVSAVNYGQELPNSYSPLPRTRRQTDEEYCTFVARRAYCSTSNVQNVINSISTCRDETKATTAIIEIKNFCQKTEQGLLCAEALEYVDGNCTGSNCTPGCSNTLRLAGCCANRITNLRLRRYLANCNISLPPPCKNSNLRIPNIVPERSCTSHDYPLNTASCNNIEPIIAALGEACSKENVEILRDLCSSRRNGQFCRDEFINSSSIGLQAIMKSDNDCPLASSCPLQCHTSLNLVKNTVGCCFPYINTTTFFSSAQSQSSIYSTELWNTCEIPVPQRCGGFSIVHNSSFASLLCLIIAGLAMVFAQRM